MIFEQIQSEPMGNFSYVIGDEESREGAVVDPGFDLETIIKTVLRNRLRVKYVINTHEHVDHSAGNTELATKMGASVVAHEDVQIVKDIPVRDGSILKLGKTDIKIIHTSGHSPDSICILVDGKKLLTGDTLFVGECGRVDLPGGSAEDLYDSLFWKLMKLSDDIEVYPGHNYGASPSSTIGFEKQHNYVLKPRTKEEFVRFMARP